MERKTDLTAVYAAALMLFSAAVCVGASGGNGTAPGPDFRVETVTEGVEVLHVNLVQDGSGQTRITFRTDEGLRTAVRKSDGWRVKKASSTTSGASPLAELPEGFSQIARTRDSGGQLRVLASRKGDSSLWYFAREDTEWQQEQIVSAGRTSSGCLAVDGKGVAHVALSRNRREANYAVRSAKGNWLIYSISKTDSRVARKSLSLNLVDGQPRMTFADGDSLHYVEFPVAESLTPPAELPPAPKGKAWNLVWQDEFSGEKLDGDKWQLPDQRRRDAWWTPRAVEVDGEGHLVIKAFKEDGKYYDGCARTRNRFEKAFGYFTARIRLQKYPGHWTAFWMWDPKMGRIGHKGMDGTEIDIMEKPWMDERVQHTLHWDGYGKHHGSAGHVSKNPGIMDGWHTFSLLWTPDEYVFYVDGEEEWRTSAGGVCQVPLYLKLSDEIQFDSWAGDIRDSTVPDEFLTDYVRVYDLVDSETGKPVMKPKDYRD